MSRVFRRLQFPRMRGLLALGVLLFLCGCSSVFDARSQKKEMIGLYTSGNFDACSRIAAEKAEKHRSTGDELMWRYEEGSSAFAKGDYAKSIAAFERAEEIQANFENRAVVNAREVGAEAGAAVTNQNALPYQGTYVEKILLNAHKALAYFALGDSNGARVELRRMYERQKETQRRFEEDIAAAKKEASEKKLNAEKILDSSPEMKEFRKELQSQSGAYGDFMNPFATYLSALGYISEGKFSEALIDFENLHRMIPGNFIVQRDYVSCAKKLGRPIPEDLAEVKPLSYPLDNNIAYVIVADGLAAAKKDMTIHLVLPPPIGYTGIAFPVLEYFPKPLSGVLIEDSCGNSYETLPLANMDAVISREYDQALTAMITRLVINFIVKEGASAAAVEVARQQGNDWAWLAVLIGTSIYKYTFNTADTRCWQTLPKEYQIMPLPLPPDGRLKLSPAGDPEKSVEIQLDKRRKMAIVYVMAPGPGVFDVKIFEFN